MQIHSLKSWVTYQLSPNLAPFFLSTNLALVKS